MVKKPKVKKPKYNAVLVNALSEFVDNTRELLDAKDHIYIQFLMYAQTDSDEDGRILTLKIRFGELFDAVKWYYESETRSQLVYNAEDVNEFCKVYAHKLYIWMREHEESPYIQGLAKRYFVNTHYSKK